MKVGRSVLSKIHLSEDVDIFGVHQGDWEHVAIRLEGGKATQIETYAHGKPTEPINWGSVHKENAHPIIYGAQGSHASYVSTGYHENCKSVGCIVDPTGRGTRWDISLSVTDAHRQPWYGFGGGWGQSRELGENRNGHRPPT